MQTRYLYTAQQFDSASGNYSLRARTYAPALARFFSQDTYPYDFQNPVELNRYVYAINNPVRYMDASGYTASLEANLTYTPSLFWYNTFAKVAIGTIDSCIAMYQISKVWAEMPSSMLLTGLELLIPSPSLCHIPIMLYPSPGTPTVATHMRIAQLKGQPMLLNYISGGNYQSNRDSACGKLTREVGFSCDEYPFASTEEGGFGASVALVPAVENKRQGGYINSFYRFSMLLRPGPFAVVIVDFYLWGVTP